MERYMRIAVPGAVAGFILSMLVALFAGVPFGVLIVRGLVSAAVLGAGGAALFFAAERLLPGLADGSEPSLDDLSDASAASNVTQDTRRVDIVLDDEDTESGAESDVHDSDGDGTGSSEEEIDVEDETAGERRVDPHFEDDDLVEEVEEQRVSSPGAMMNQAVDEQKNGGGIEIDDAVLDEMPDIGAFSSTFSSAESGDGDIAGNGSLDGFETAGSGGESRSGTPRSGGMAGNDPALIAKALKTMLSRDEKE